MEDHLKDHVAISENADVAGMQVKYELWRITKLVQDGNPPVSSSSINVAGRPI